MNPTPPPKADPMCLPSSLTPGYKTFKCPDIDHLNETQCTIVTTEVVKRGADCGKSRTKDPPWLLNGTVLAVGKNGGILFKDTGGKTKARVEGSTIRTTKGTKVASLNGTTIINSTGDVLATVEGTEIKHLDGLVRPKTNFKGTVITHFNGSVIAEIVAGNLITDQSGNDVGELVNQNSAIVNLRGILIGEVKNNLITDLRTVLSPRVVDTLIVYSNGTEIGKIHGNEIINPNGTIIGYLNNNVITDLNGMSVAKVNGMNIIDIRRTEESIPGLNGTVPTNINETADHDNVALIPNLNGSRIKYILEHMLANLNGTVLIKVNGNKMMDLDGSQIVAFNGMKMKNIVGIKIVMPSYTFDCYDVVLYHYNWNEICYSDLWYTCLRGNINKTSFPNGVPKTGAKNGTNNNQPASGKDPIDELLCVNLRNLCKLLNISRKLCDHVGKRGQCGNYHEFCAQKIFDPADYRDRRVFDFYLRP